MTLYKALIALSTDFDGDFTINFPKGFPIESGDMGFSGATFAEIAMNAPEAFTLTVTNITIRHDTWDVVEIDTEYGKDYIGNLEDTLMGGDKSMTIEEALDVHGFDPKVNGARDFTLRECDEIAKLADTTIYEVIETLGTITA